MSLRQRRFWWAAGIIATLAGGIVLTYVIATNTDRGRRWLLAALVQRAQGVFGGRATIKIGALQHIGLSGIRASDVSLLDTAGVPVVHADHLEGSLDFRSLWNNVIHLNRLSLAGVKVDFHQDFSGPWNITYIISGSKVKGPPHLKLQYGDDIRIDTIQLTNAEMTLVSPWSPHPVFTGSARDSVIAARKSLHDILQTSHGLLERRRIALQHVVAHDGIIAQPHGIPSSMVLDTVVGTISDPPVRIVAASGRIRWTPDSLHLDLPVFRLPASSGSTRGLIAWNMPGPVRYDIEVKTQAGLSDLTWIWDVLPTTGSGSALVHMRTLTDPYDTEYALTQLDVQSMASRIRGNISVITRPADMLLHSIDLTFAPMQSDLLRRLTYGAIPDSVRGSMEGRLVAKKGGALRAFTIDQLDARFTDARVANALSSIRLAGDVAFGAHPSARGLNIQGLSVDVRTARALVPTLPAIDGVVRGSGRIVAGDLRMVDVRNLALTWTDAASNTTAVRGDARVGFGTKIPTVVASLQLDPLSLRALARIDTTFPARSLLRGPITVKGSTDALQWTANLNVADGGRVALQGTAALSASAWKMSADGTTNSLDARAWLARTDVPRTALDGTITVVASGSRRGTSGATVNDATVAIALKQNAIGDNVAFDFTAAGALDAIHLRVDSASAHLGGVTFDAHGMLARSMSTHGTAETDTMVVSARADSLSAVRGELDRMASMIAPMDSGLAVTLRHYAKDALEGDLSLSGYMFGAIDDFGTTLAFGARAMQVGAIHVGRIFGSTHAEHLRTHPTFEGAATADEIEGIAAVNIATLDFKVQQASPDGGRLVLDVSSRDTAHLVVRGAYTRADGAVDVALDSVRFGYDVNSWRNAGPIHLRSDARGIRIDSLELRSTAKGVFALSADVPTDGAIRADVRLDRFPIGEAMAFTMGTRQFSSALSGSAQLSGTRDAPLLAFKMLADSLGLNGNYLPAISADGLYAQRRLIAHAVLADSGHGAIRVEARLPLDLALHAVDKRLLSDVVDAEIVADSLKLDALRISVSGIDKLRGVVAGRLALTGTIDRPVATGTLTLERFAANLSTLGITPSDGRIVLRAAQDSLILETLRIRSGGVGDTIGATGAIRFASGQPATMRLSMVANNAALAHQSDGTDMNVSGNIDLVGPVKRPALSGQLFIPKANLVIDPLGASKALDLTTAAARDLLGVDEVPVVASAARSFAQLGSYLTVSNARVDLGNEVWVKTPEAKVKLQGGLTVTSNGDLLALEGEITSNRGQYKLDLGVTNRSFAIDSGSVRFYGRDAIEPTLDLSATNVVRLSTGEEIPVRVHIGGTLTRPVLSLTSSDPLYASAPESEIISLLIFGAPTFALDGRAQSTVKSVTGVLLPSYVGGVVEGALQRLLPVFNTVQVVTATGARDDLSAYSLLDNLSISAGKQLGDRTFLRLNTGVCRGSSATASRGASVWYGVAVEYRVSRDLSAQIGVDPGAAPCSRLGGDVQPRQVGFDLFRQWIF